MEKFQPIRISRISYSLNGFCCEPRSKLAENELKHTINLRFCFTNLPLPLPFQFFVDFCFDFQCHACLIQFFHGFLSIKLNVKLFCA